MLSDWGHQWKELTMVTPPHSINNEVGQCDRRDGSNRKSFDRFSGTSMSSDEGEESEEGD
jgi:hypothetical protein